MTSINFLMDFNLEMFDDRIIYSDKDFYIYAGMYGEDLMFSYVEETKQWHFSSLVLDVFDLKFGDEGKLLLLIIYCFNGIKDFNIKKSNCRDLQSVKIVRKFYNEYKKTNDSRYLNLLKREIEHICYYVRKKRKFSDWIIAGDDKSLDEVPKEKIDLFLNIRKEVIEKEKAKKKEEKLKWKRRHRRNKNYCNL